MNARTWRTASMLSLLSVASVNWTVHGQGARRTILETDWRLVGGVAAAVESPLLRPLLFAADTGQLYVFDYGDHKLKAFGWDGELRWTVGRAGRGPVEFSNPTDLQLASDGRIWLTDPPNVRVTIVDRSGQVSRMMRTPRPVNRIIPLLENKCWGTDNSEEWTFLLDSSGTVQTLAHLPLEVENADPMSREPRVAASPDGKVGVIGFMYAGAVLVVDSTGVRSFFRGIEPLAFPEIEQWEREGMLFTRLDPSAPYGTLSLSVSNGRIFVLFGGRGEYSGRILDTYSLEGTYEGSYVLPEKASRIAVMGDNVAALVQTPLPAIKVWHREAVGGR